MRVEASLMIVLPGRLILLCWGRHLETLDGQRGCSRGVGALVVRQCGS